MTMTPKRAKKRPQQGAPSSGQGFQTRANPLKIVRLNGFPVAFAKAQDGAVAVAAGLAIPVLLGLRGLALEYGQAMVVRAEAQRTADLASYAGAVAYARSGDTAQMVAAGQAVGRLNGFSEAEISVVLDTSVPTASGAAVRATITRPKPLYLPSLVGGDTSVDITASALAGALGGKPACVQALDPGGGGITLSGEAGLLMNECSVASNAEVTAPCGTSIVTSALSYDSSAAPATGSCDTIRTPEGEVAQMTQQPTPDPLEGSDARSLASAQMARTAALGDPDTDLDDMGVATGPDIHFGWSQSATTAQAEAIGCSATFASYNDEWTLSCPGLTTVSLGSITIGGGLSLNFNPGAPSSVVYNMSGSIRNTANRMIFPGGTYNIGQDIFTDGSSVTEFGDGTFRIAGSIRNDGKRMTFGDGTYEVGKGLVAYGGSVTNFGAGTYRFGRSDKDCEGARYSVCNFSQLTFDGPGDFVLAGGIRNNGGATLTLGTGTGNSFRFGRSSGGDAISVDGGSQTYMGDAVGGLFEVAGHIDGGGGGSCLVFPAAELHEINGPINASGAIRFGAGLYAINGYMHLGNDGGGSALCGGETISVEAPNTTFVVSAAGTEPAGSDCAGQAFCVTAGYSDVTFTAPQSGPYTDLAFVGPLDGLRTEGALFAGGAGDSTVSGAFYFPGGPITLSGGASASSGAGGCLQLIGSEITMSGGTSVASKCNLPGAETQGRVVLLR